MNQYFKNICSVLRQAFLLLLFLLYTPQILANDSLVFNSTGQPPINTIKQNGFLDDLLRDALLRIGYRLTVERMPAERGLRNANKGLIDGEMSRIKGIDKVYPNLVRVPEKVMDWEFVIFSRKPIDATRGWKGLAGVRVGYITGWKILENNVPSTAVVTKARNSSQLFRLLNRGRVDAVIYERWAGLLIVQSSGYTGVKIRWPALAKKKMYIYLHSRHRNIVSKLRAAVAGMKKDGSYQRLVKKHFGFLEN